MVNNFNPLKMRDQLRQLITESDNRTHDLVRYLSAIAVLAGIGLTVYSVYKGAPFSIQDYGIGIGSLIGGIGAALGLKKESGESEL